MPEPRILVVEHQASCPPALIGEWLEEAGCLLEVWRPWMGTGSPGDLTSYDALLVLGGEMGAYDDASHPWLTRTKELLRQAAASGLPSLGICLGHQLTTVALDGGVDVNPAGQAVGLQPVGWTTAAVDDPLVGVVATQRPLARGIHWNNDVVTGLPAQAQLLARSSDGAPQVVRYAERSWGVQLHPEADEEIVREWAEGDRADHLERGIDTDAALDAIAEAEEELTATWRPLAFAFAGLARS